MCLMDDGQRLFVVSLEENQKLKKRAEPVSSGWAVVVRFDSSGRVE